MTNTLLWLAAVTITAIDTNVLLDLLSPEGSQKADALTALTNLAEDDLVICEVVFAELAAAFTRAAELEDFLDSNQINVMASDAGTLFLAGRAWHEYVRRRPMGLVCPSCGTETIARCGQCQTVMSIRPRTLPDFYIAAHALVHADRLMTRDKRHFQTYFPQLPLI